jgi:hypothetical protein
MCHPERKRGNSTMCHPERTRGVDYVSSRAQARDLDHAEQARFLASFAMRLGMTRTAAQRNSSGVTV